MEGGPRTRPTANPNPFSPHWGGWVHQLWPNSTFGEIPKPFLVGVLADRARARHENGSENFFFNFSNAVLFFK